MSPTPPAPSLTPIPSPSVSPPSTTEPPAPTETVGPPINIPPPCGEADPTCASLTVQQTRDIDFTGPVPCGPDGSTCLLKIDSFALPAPRARDLPIVLMIPGGPLPPGNRDYLWELARIVAGRGAVVFTSDYRSSPAYGGGYPSTFADVACAIRFARQKGAELGGDPGRVTLVAHSFGGIPGAVVALSTHDFATDEPACLATTGDGRPDAFVGIAGIYTLDRVGPTFLATFFGGDRTTAPDAWDAGDATTILAGKPHRMPIRLLAGSNDLVAPEATMDEFATLLRDAGYDVTATTLDGATHDSILQKLATVDAVARLAIEGR